MKLGEVEIQGTPALPTRESGMTSALLVKEDREGAKKKLCCCILCCGVCYRRCCGVIIVSIYTQIHSIATNVTVPDTKC